MGVVELFIAASVPVLEVLVVTAIGTCLALDGVDILGDEARKHVNNVVFYVLNPALVASKLSQTITYDSVVKLWFMPLNILLTFIVGSILGWVLVQFTNPPSHLRGLVVGCCAAGNLGNMLLILVPAVCTQKASPFGSPDACHSLAFAYVSLSMAIGAVYLWSYVYNLVRASSNRKGLEESQLLHFVKSATESSQPLLVSQDSLTSQTHSDQLAVPVTVLENLKKQLGTLSTSVNWKSLLAPSTVGALVGFGIGVIPFIRNLMIGQEAPLRVIQDSASLLGEAAVPTLNLILGGNLLKGLRGGGIQKSMIFGVIIVRYVASPTIGIFIVKGATHLGFIPNDPLYQFVLLLQFAMPPAMNIGTITQLFGAGETECSVIMLWSYSLASISLTLWSTFFLWLVS